MCTQNEREKKVNQKWHFLPLFSNRRTFSKHAVMCKLEAQLRKRIWADPSGLDPLRTKDSEIYLDKEMRYQILKKTKYFQKKRKTK